MPRVLVVDDDPYVRGALTRRLGRAAVVDAVASVTDAIDLIEAHDEVAVIVADLVLPGASGMELLSWLRTHRPGMADRFVLLSGVVDHEPAVMAAGVPVVCKGDSPDRLDAIVTAMLALAEV